MKTLAAIFILAIGSALLAPLGAAKALQTAPTVAGKWHFVMATDGGNRVFDPVFQQDGDRVTGKWGNSDVQGTFADGKLDLAFPVNSDEGGAGTLKLKGALAGDALSGDWSFNDYGGSFKATRLKE